MNGPSCPKRKKMKLFFLFSFAISLFFTTIVHAEYRVFVLKLSQPNPDKTLPTIERTLLSNLDPVQYRGYYPVQPDEQVEYIDTWRCTGRTGDFQDYCPKPASADTASPSPQKAQITEPNVSN